MLGERRSAILEMIIDYYIRTGEPMGSKTLCQMLPYSISSATIRNEMAFLTSVGFLEQRHTSGGRVPTKAAYRYYIDNIINGGTLSPYEKQKIDEVLSTNASDPERLLANASKLLSELTGCAAFYSTVKDPLDCVQGIESSICKINCPVDDEFKQIFYSITNEFFIGVPLSDIDLSLIQSTAPFLKDKIFDMLPVLSSLCSLCAEASEGSLVINGETRLLSQSELGDSVYNLLLLLAQKDKLAAMLESFAKTTAKAQLLIGDENPMYELRNTTMAIAKLQYSDMQTATIGIIGSTRIDYKRILPTVDYIINAVSQLLLEGGARYE